MAKKGGAISVSHGDGDDGDVTLEPNTLAVEKWVDRIATAWQKQIPSIFEVGNFLEAAKAELKHGQFVEMVKNKLPFSRQTANKLMKIAQFEPFRNDAARRHLPANWTILNHLCLLTEEKFEEGVKNGIINPKMKTRDAKMLRGIEEKKRQGSSGVRSVKQIVTNLNSLAWSDASPEKRRQFVEAVGPRAFWEVMSEGGRESLCRIVDEYLK
jgi:Protein of unknown function (DUF3102)